MGEAGDAHAQDMPIGKDSAHFFGINYAMPIDSKVGYSPVPVMPQDFSGQNLPGCSFKGQDLAGANFSDADFIF
ncbi:MAG: pentapeptide repeat-containing protein [Coleofasciculus sp. G3-WIS-01]